MASDVEKNPYGTWVFKTRVSPFYFPSSSLCSSDLAFFFMQIWRPDRPITHPAFNHPIRAPAFFILHSSSLDRSSSNLFFLYSSSLFFVRSFFLFFFRSVLQVPKSSLRDSVLLFRTWVYKTQDLSGIIFATH